MLNVTSSLHNPCYPGTGVRLLASAATLMRRNLISEIIPYDDTCDDVLHLSDALGGNRRYCQ